VTTHQLQTPPYLNPLWFNQVRHGQHALVVAADGAIALAGETLRFRGDGLAPGTPVEVWISGGLFVCAAQGDLAREAEERRRKQEQVALAERERRNALRDEAATFNACIRLPVGWDVAIKDVLSGLSATSAGDGRRKDTVHHIRLLEPLVEGRLKRGAGDFLCTSARGSNGKRWSSVAEQWQDGEGAAYAPKVTCKACLRHAGRWWVTNEGSGSLEEPR
jgi:hypothetical protein